MPSYIHTYWWHAVYKSSSQLNCKTHLREKYSNQYLADFTLSLPLGSDAAASAASGDRGTWFWGAAVDIIRCHHDANNSFKNCMINITLML